MCCTVARSKDAVRPSDHARSRALAIGEKRTAIQRDLFRSEMYVPDYQLGSVSYPLPVGAAAATSEREDPRRKAAADQPDHCGEWLRDAC